MAAAEYYERCRPLIQRTVEATEKLAASYDEDKRLDALVCNRAEEANCRWWRGC